MWGCSWVDRGPTHLMECRQLSARGVRAAQRNDHQQAEELLAKAVETYGADAEARRQYAAVLWERGARDAAINQLNQAIPLIGDDALLYVRRAEYHRAMNNASAAQADVEAAIDADPRSVAAWLLQARLARDQGELPRALAAYHRVLSHEPGHREALWEKAQVHWTLAQRVSPPTASNLQQSLIAVQVFLDAHSPGTEPTDGLLLAAEIQGRLGRADDAVQLLSLAARRDSNRSDVWCSLAAAQHAAGNNDEALVSAQRALAISPQNIAGQQLLQQIRLAQVGRALSR